MSSPCSSYPRIGAALALLVGVASTPLARAADVSPAANDGGPAYVAGVYECEGSTVQATSGYAGPVSLRALLALDFDLALGLARHGGIATVEVIQEPALFSMRTIRADHSVEWTAEWKRNGGFEATKDVVKVLIRAKRGTADLYLFSFSNVKNGSALAVTVQKVVPDTFGPIGQEVGTFLFLRKAP